LFRKRKILELTEPRRLTADDLLRWTVIDTQHGGKNEVVAHYWSTDDNGFLSFLTEMEHTGRWSNMVVEAWAPGTWQKVTLEGVKATEIPPLPPAHDA